MCPAGDPIIQTLKFLMDQDLHNLYVSLLYSVTKTETNLVSEK